MTVPYTCSACGNDYIKEEPYYCPECEHKVCRLCFVPSENMCYDCSMDETDEWEEGTDWAWDYVEGDDE